jgi:hypothetical protein
MLGGVELPPIEVYKLDELYFVRDGHHRVSVARSLGYETTRANVIEVRTRVPLPQGIDPRDLLCTAEYADKRLTIDGVRVFTVRNVYAEMVTAWARHAWTVLETMHRMRSRTTSVHPSGKGGKRRVLSGVAGLCPGQEPPVS